MNERKLLEILKEKDEQLNKWYLSYNEVLEENEKLKQELGNLKMAYTVSVDKAIMIEQELQEQIERMKCCENCKHYKYDCANGYDCDLGVIDKWKTYHKKCNKWEMAE